MELIEKIAEIIENNSGDIAYGYSNETSAEFRKCILTPLAGRIHQLILSHYSQAEEVLSEEFEEKLTELSTNLNGCAYPMGQETCRYPDDGDCVRCFSDQIKEFIQAQAAHSRLKFEAEKEQAVKAAVEAERFRVRPIEQAANEDAYERGANDATDLLKARYDKAVIDAVKRERERIIKKVEKYMRNVLDVNPKKLEAWQALKGEG